MKKKLFVGALSLVMVLGLPATALAGQWKLTNNSSYMYLEKGKPVKSSWVKSGKAWYYMKADGSMAANESLKIGGSNYLFYKNGKMATGWVKSGNDWHYYYSGGSQAINKWVKSGGSWYYMDENGKMLTRTLKKIGNKEYLFRKDGKMQNGWYQSTGDVWLYFDNGAMAHDKWIKSSGNWYYIRPDGRMAANTILGVNGKPYIFNRNGKMLTGWIWSGHDWYYSNRSGVMATEKWQGNYYLGKDGKMVTNQWVGKYYVDGSGKWVKTAKQPNANKPAANSNTNKPATTTSTTTSAASKNGPFLAKDELSYVNKTREAVGKAPLKWNPRLEQAALVRAKELAAQFSHTRPDGSSPETAAPRGWSAYGENIAQTWEANGYAQVSNLWNNSPKHYGNRVLGHYTDYACGKYVDSEGRVFWVELFSNML